jgi:hypothetical protein
MDLVNWAVATLSTVGPMSPRVGPEEVNLEGAEVDLSKVKLTLPKKEEAEEPKWIRFIKSFDGYGESDDKYDPIAHPKVSRPPYVRPIGSVLISIRPPRDHAVRRRWLAA